jgi:hypothetical protein
MVEFAVLESSILALLVSGNKPAHANNCKAAARIEDDFFMSDICFSLDLTGPYFQGGISRCGWFRNGTECRLPSYWSGSAPGKTLRNNGWFVPNWLESANPKSGEPIDLLAKDVNGVWQ